MASAAPELVVLDYAELIAPVVSEELKAKIGKAYSYDGLGILAVKGVPDFAAIREAALPQAFKFAHLPDAVKEKYVSKEALYQFGWSHGVESTEGVPDERKGSFYFNAAGDKPVEDPELIRRFPTFITPNIWPTEEDCAGFEAACKALSGKIVEIGKLVGRAIDAYVHSVESTYPPEMLHKIIETSRVHKARLLHYFAADASSKPTPVPVDPSAAGKEEFSSWCGWHNDTGSLTGLAPAMFFDKDGHSIPCPDPQAGLYIRTRHNQTLHMKVPSDYIAYQIGETAQIHSGGILQATPHCVRATEMPGVSRCTLAVFMEPDWDFPMNVPSGRDGSEVVRVGAELLPRGVPTMASRWAPGQDFNGFLSASLAAYHPGM